MFSVSRGLYEASLPFWLDIFPLTVRLKRSEKLSSFDPAANRHFYQGDNSNGICVPLTVILPKCLL
jgi:hypothetical protein